MTIIPTSPSTNSVKPNFTDYDGERTRFSWSDIERQLGPAPGGCNIAYYAVDRHDCDSHRNEIAFRFVGPNTNDVGELATTEMTFGEFALQVRKFTDVLRELGVGKGDPVVVFTGRIPELYVSILGALRNGNIVSPLFSAFGPEPLATRIRLGDAHVLVTTEQLYRRRVEKIRGSLPSLRHILVVGDSGSTTDIPDTLDFHSAMADATGTATSPRPPPTMLPCCISPVEPPVPRRVRSTPRRRGHTLCNRTVRPRPASLGRVLVHGRSGLGHRHVVRGDHTAVARRHVDRRQQRIRRRTVVPHPRRAGRHGLVHRADRDPHADEVRSGAGAQVLPPEPAVHRERRRTAQPRRRVVGTRCARTAHPRQLVANRDGRHHDRQHTRFAIKPGSMGRPLPGIDACIVRRTDDGGTAPVETPNVEGELAIRRGWPSMFRGYLNNDDRYRRAFAGDWYLTGDLAKRDADGYYWFVGRADDVIKSAGHLIGPFEVENVLMEHPAVAEAGVIGKPDPIVGAVVKAFVSVKKGQNPDDALRRELLGHSRKKLGAAVAPKEIEFVDVLPHTRSGKIMRRLLKARELGLPEGDTSTLEVGG